ncbi:MAG: hypothetical protein WC673_00295 [Candidatus Paceibacterota bacterium]|jgi:hypothetical protein
MKILKNVFLLVVVVGLSYLLSYPIGSLYGSLFTGTGSFVDMTSLLGIPLAYIFLLTSVFTVWGGTKKYWWIGIGLIPVAIVELYLDPNRIYFPILLGFLGWLVGFGIRKLFVGKK